MKKYAGSLLMLGIFEAVAITLWLTMDNLFYLLNFSYISCSTISALSYIKATSM